MLKKIIILLLVILFGFFLYLKSKDSIEINVSYINFYIKNKISSGSHVNIRNTLFVWKKESKDPCLMIKDLIIENHNVTIKIPKLVVYFEFSSLFRARTNFSRVLTNNVSMYINKKTNLKDVDFNLRDSLGMVWDSFFSLSENAKIEVTNVIIHKNIEDEFYIDKLYITKKRNLYINIHTQSDKRILDNLSVVVKNRNDLLIINGEFYNLKLGEDANLNGNFSVKINKKNEVLNGDIYILSADKNSTTLRDVNIKLVYHDQLLSVKNFHFNLKDMYLSLVGKMNFGTNHALLRVNISKFSAKDVCAYMPDSAAKFKDWYCSNIDGDIVNTVIDFSGKVNESNLSNVKITADIENGSVKFDDDFVPVEKLNGNLKLKNGNLEITVDNAKFQNFAINGGNININSLEREDAVLVIHGQATSNAYGLYEPVKFKLDKVLTIEKDKINGTAESKFSFQVFNLTNDKKADFLADFNVKINNLTTYDANIDKYDIKLKFGRDFIDLSGSGIVNNKQLLLNFKEHDKHYTCEFNGDLPAQIFGNMVGYVGVDVKSVINPDDTGFINGNVDLSELSLSSNYLGWNNHFEDHNKVQFSVALEGSNKLLINRLDVTGNNLNIKLNGRVEDGNLRLDSTNFDLPDNDFNITIESSKEKSVVIIYGEKINLSNIPEWLAGSNGGPGKSIEVKMDIDNVIMQNGITIHNAELNLICTQGDCNGSGFTGKFSQDNSNIRAKYSEIGLEIYADNAGIFLRSLGINQSVKNGKMSFYLSSEREEGERYGMISISDFYVKDAPLLTTLLSMSSLPGIVNALNKEGIHFYKCNIPFSYNDNTIEIEESWIEGAELGITTSGKLSIQDRKFQVKGQVIPAYSVNKFIFKIPIIGKLLTGGKSRGIVAIDYKASGDDKNSNVFVDFISSLTPSVLKRVLGIFDHIMIRTSQKLKLS
ncbi:MAG: AsmA-like C-terminal domain-containing protein [Wolbachia endosymbiont of Tyrophagus putrescentiae]|nr:AsmA-like C-terminal domain-containing protein [Wolbachia endosymbiont of Tyrophagus putrescentiae]